MDHSNRLIWKEFWIEQSGANNKPSAKKILFGLDKGQLEINELVLIHKSMLDDNTLVWNRM